MIITDCYMIEERGVKSDLPWESKTPSLSLLGRGKVPSHGPSNSLLKLSIILRRTYRYRILTAPPAGSGLLSIPKSHLDKILLLILHLCEAAPFPPTQSLPITARSRAVKGKNEGE